MNAFEISEFIANLKIGDIPKPVVQMSKRCFLDFLSTAIAAQELPAVNCGLGFLELLGKSEEATIIGSKRKVPLMGAVWANALLASALDLEDGHYPSVGHPASNIFPVALGVAEREHSTPQDFLAAAIVGYEICTRSGIIMTRPYKEGIHGSGKHSVYGATATAARLLNLDGHRVQMALGMSGYYMPAIPVMKAIKEGAMTKGGVPWGAVLGLTSAFLSLHGFTSPPPTLEHPFAPEENENTKRIFKDLGVEYEIMKVYFKRYPACRWAHAPIDAVMAILKEHGTQWVQVRSVLVETFEVALSLNHCRPKSLEAAQYSIPFTVATTIVKGEFGVRQMDLKYLDDPKILEVANRVELKLDPKLNQLYPRKRPARVTITTDDGQIFQKEIMDVHGEPGTDFAEEGVRDKFISIVSKILGGQESKHIYEIVDHLDELRDFDELLNLLRG